MSLDNFVNGIQSGFAILTSNSFFGLPLLAWVIITAIIAFIGLFIKGTKK